MQTATKIDRQRTTYDSHAHIRAGESGCRQIIRKIIVSDLAFVSDEIPSETLTYRDAGLQRSSGYVVDHNNFTGYAQTVIETTKNASGVAVKRTTYTFGTDELTQTVSQIDPITG
jgi:hypothetical protein